MLTAAIVAIVLGVCMLVGAGVWGWLNGYPSGHTVEANDYGERRRTS